MATKTTTKMDAADLAAVRLLTDLANQIDSNTVLGMAGRQTLNAAIRSLAYRKATK